MTTSNTIYFLKTLALAIIMCGCMSSTALLPPTITLRDISGPERFARGETVLLQENIWLFIPKGYSVPKDGKIRLAAHFHGTPWFIKEEHTRRGVCIPLLLHGGLQGSSNYTRPFLDHNLFAQLISKVENHFNQQNDVNKARVAKVEVSSFSAGYGAVRELLKSPEYVELIDTLILADSLFASFAVPGGGDDRRPLPEHMKPFISFAQLAVKGEKTFVMSHCNIVTQSFASTADTAKALLEGVGGTFSQVPPDSILSAAPQLDYPLLYRYDRGGLHIWGYGGNTPKAHMAQARALADFWKVIDAEKHHNTNSRRQ
jgi:hypothetical protein